MHISTVTSSPYTLYVPSVHLYVPIHFFQVYTYLIHVLVRCIHSLLLGIIVVVIDQWSGYNLLYTVFFPPYLRHVGPACLQYKISFDVGVRENLKAFDVALGPAQIMPFCHALKFARGEHCYICYYHRSMLFFPTITIPMTCS